MTRPPARTIGRGLLACGLLLAVLFGSRGITDEAAVSTQGDMPRYLMNGVFLYDFVATGGAWTVQDAVDYAQRYFAKYPALSVGHHPPLLSVALVPFYAVFGVSVLSGRLAVVAFYVWSVWLLYLLGRRVYGEEVGGWASLLFATTPFIVPFGQQTMSEMPMIAMVLLTMNLLFRFGESGRATDFILLAVSAVASLAAKQLAAFAFPVFLWVLATGGRWRQLLQGTVMLMTIASGLVVVSMVVATFVLSPFNAYAALEKLTSWQGTAEAWNIVRQILVEHLSPGVAVCCVAAVGVAAVRYDRRIALSLVWMLTVIACVIQIVGSFEPPRYSILAVPAYCLCAASLAAWAQPRFARIVTTVLLVWAVASQGLVAAVIRPVGAGGYEQAAAFIARQDGGPTVMFSGSVDTGYFVFFMRKHDPGGHWVVLRSDKVLTTSFMSSVTFEERIKSREEIDPLLQTYGTRFVVIEDQPTDSPALNWLRDEVKTDRFIERLRIPMASRDRRLRGTSLAVYEYKDVKPPDPNAELDLKIPLVGREIRVPLSDLVGPEAR